MAETGRLTMPTMQGIPFILKLAGQRCVIVGGGSLAARRAAALAEAQADVHIIAHSIVSALESMPVTLHLRAYAPGDLAGTKLVVIATNDETLNDAIQREAQEMGVLVNRADRGSAGDLTFMARASVGPVTLAVDSGCAMPAAAAKIRDELAASLREHWPAMLAIAEPFRRQIASNVNHAPQRAHRIELLTSTQAITIFTSQGPEAFTRYCVALARLADGTDPASEPTEAAP